jgi:hypothetical protein
LVHSIRRIMFVEVAAQVYLLTDGSDNFLRLATSDWLIEIVGFAIEKDKMVAIFDDHWICSKIFFYYFLDTIINDNILACLLRQNVL